MLRIKINNELKMFQKGDLVWIPSNTVLLVPHPNNPETIRITNEPEVAVFIERAKEDEDFCIIISDGRRWSTNKKHIKHLRKEYVS